MYSIGYKAIAMHTHRDAHTPPSCHAMTETFRFSYIKHDTCTLKQQQTTTVDDFFHSYRQ